MDVRKRRIRKLPLILKSSKLVVGPNKLRVYRLARPFQNRIFNYLNRIKSVDIRIETPVHHQWCLLQVS